MAELLEPLDLTALPDLSSPVLAIAAHNGDIWLGGLGGVARLGSGVPGPQGPLTSVAALRAGAAVVLAGGTEGIAWCSRSSPEVWENADVQSGGSPVAAMVTTPTGTVIAATLGDGILRSTDNGRTWVSAGFGLDTAEVCALAADARDGLLAATPHGVFGSRNEGKAWRRCPGTEGYAIAALAFGPDGAAMAVTEDGLALRTIDGGDTWSKASALRGIPTALTALADGTFLAGTAGTGVWQSRDAGATWAQGPGIAAVRTVYCLASDSNRAYAGTSEGLAGWAPGESWRRLPAPATYDYTHALLWKGRRLVIGSRSGLVHEQADGTWKPLPDPPLPLTCVAVTPDDVLVVSGPSGLYLHNQKEWECVIEGPDGMTGRMAFRDNGFGLASSPEHGDVLLRTGDYGRTWETVAAPFGVLPPTKLQFFEHAVMVETIDQRHNVLTVWGSRDDGTTWEQVWRGPNGAPDRPSQGAGE